MGGAGPRPIENGVVAGLQPLGEAAAIAPGDSVILATPPQITQELLPGTTAPDRFSPIVNGHFRIAPPRGRPADGRCGRRGGALGVRLCRSPVGDRQRRRRHRRGGASRWPVASGATWPPYLCWRPCRPGRSSRSAGRPSWRRRSRMRVVRRRAPQPVPGRRLDRHRPAGDHRGRHPLGRHGRAPSATSAADVRPRAPNRSRRHGTPLPALVAATTATEALDAHRESGGGFLARQRSDGHWLFELEADATIPAEYVLLGHYSARRQTSNSKARSRSTFAASRPRTAAGRCFMPAPSTLAPPSKPISP